MKMNEKLLAQAYEDLKGDLNNQYLGFQEGDNVVVKNSATGDYLTVHCSNKSVIQQNNIVYVSTVEEFNNYSPEKHSSEGERLGETIIQMESTQEVKSPCKTKQKLHTAKNTILGMEMFLEEVGLLETWNDNKSEYLEEE